MNFFEIISIVTDLATSNDILNTMGALRLSIWEASFQVDLSENTPISLKGRWLQLHGHWVASMVLLEIVSVDPVDPVDSTTLYDSLLWRHW